MSPIISDTVGVISESPKEGQFCQTKTKTCDDASVSSKLQPHTEVCEQKGGPSDSHSNPHHSYQQDNVLKVDAQKQTSCEPKTVTLPPTEELPLKESQHNDNRRNCEPIDMDYDFAVKWDRFLSLKYVDRKGHQQELHLINELSPNWWDIGVTLGLSGNILKGIEIDHRCVKDRFKEVIMKWRHGSLPDEYRKMFPVTWNGIIKALTESDHKEIVESLRKALACPVVPIP